jgi:hypothetical protein
MDMKAPIVLIFGLIIALLGVVIVEAPITTSSTDVTSQATSVTSAGDGTGTMVLTNTHWYNTMESVTVTGASSGDVTAGTTIGTDRKTLSLTGLGATTTQVVTTSYLAQITDSQVAIVLKVVPFLLLIGGLASSFGSAFIGVKSGMSGQGSGVGSVTTIVVVLVGVILVPIIQSFSDEVTTAYTIAPEYIGILTVLPLVTIGYIIGLLGFAFSSVAPSAKRAFGGVSG